MDLIRSDPHPTGSVDTTVDHVLLVRGLTRSYRRHRVLEGVDLEVPAGALYGIQGENGSGKSTLLKCLTGVLRPDGGTVTARGRIGYCPQEAVVVPLLTVREFLRLVAAAAGLPRAGAAARSTALLERYRAARFADTRIDRLSGGTRQKVNLVAALLDEPDLLLLDEPYQGFDHETYEVFWEHADELRRDGRSLLVVSHMHTERSRFDALLSLHEGRIREERA